MKTYLFRFVLLMCFLLTCFNPFYAQVTTKAKIHLGTELTGKAPKTYGQHGDFLGSDDTGYYVTGSYYHGYRIKKYDLNANFLVQNRFDNDNEMDKKYKITFPVYFKGHLGLMRCSSFKSDDLKKEIYFQEFDKGTLEPNPEVRKIASFQSKDNNKESHYPFIMYSDSLNKIALAEVKLFSWFPYQIQVFDYSLNLIWERKEKLPYDPEMFDLKLNKLDNADNYYCIGKLYNTKNKKESVDGKPNYSYRLFIINNHGKDTLEHILSIGDSFIQDISLVFGKDGSVLIAGSYSDLPEEQSVHGVFLFKINPQLHQVVLSKKNEFKVDFVSDGLDSKSLAKNLKLQNEGRVVEIPNYHLKKVIEGGSGDIYIIGEQDLSADWEKDIHENWKNSPNQHLYRDIVVTCLHQDGSISWDRKICKEQWTMDLALWGSSFAACAIGEKLCFVFTDNVKNLALTTPGPSSRVILTSEVGIVELATFDNKGVLTRELLGDFKDFKTPLNFKNAKMLDQNRMLINGLKENTEVMGLINFN